MTKCLLTAIGKVYASLQCFVILWSRQSHCWSWLPETPSFPKYYFWWENGGNYCRSWMCSICSSLFCSPSVAYSIMYLQFVETQSARKVPQTFNAIHNFKKWFRGCYRAPVETFCIHVTEKSEVQKIIGPFFGDERILERSRSGEGTNIYIAQGIDFHLLQNVYFSWPMKNKKFEKETSTAAYVDLILSEPPFIVWSVQNDKC